MCFSANACFTAGAILVPMGIYTLVKSYRNNKPYLALATFPLLFGLQQLIEAAVWLTFEQRVKINIQVMATGYLFFAFVLWPLCVPLAALLIEKNVKRKILFKGVCVIGFVFGSTLYVPLLIYPQWVSVTALKGSILYQTVFIYDGLVPTTLVSLVYAIIITTPLMLSTVKSLRFFGILVLVSIAISAVFFAYAFVSVWCFFAAILSTHIVYIIRTH